MAKTAGISPKRARLLNRLTGYLKVDTALELGTSLGLGSAAIAAGNDVKVTTLEGCPETVKIALENFKKFGLENVDLKVGEFNNFLESSKQRTEAGENSILDTQYSLLYIDGNHQKEATLEYFEKLLPAVHNDSLMIFDDIHWSKDMEEAWEVIKAHPKVRVSIDTFQWGLVFFRTEQEKEHFVIRV